MTREEKVEIKVALKEILDMLDSEEEEVKMNKEVTGINSCGIVTEGKITFTFKEAN